jgi:hypothetical protein
VREGEVGPAEVEEEAVGEAEEAAAVAAKDKA